MVTANRFAVVPGRMISDLDIYRAAVLVIRQYGEDAEVIAAERVDLMREREDHAGQRVWERTRRAIIDLQSAERTIALRDRLPIGAAILAYTSRAAVGIAMGATLVMVAHLVAKLIGYPIRDMAIGDAALSVWCCAVAVWLGCAALARFVD